MSRYTPEEVELNALRDALVDYAEDIRVLTEENSTLFQNNLRFERDNKILSDIVIRLTEESILSIETISELRNKQ